MEHCKACRSSELSAPAPPEALVNRRAHEGKGQQLPLQHCLPVYCLERNLDPSKRSKGKVAFGCFENVLTMGGSSVVQHGKLTAKAISCCSSVL